MTSSREDNVTDTESAKPAASKRAIRFRATLLAMIGLALLLGGYAYEAGNMAAQFHGSSIHDLSSKIIAKPTALIVAAFSSIGFLILSYLYLHYADEHERHANL